jgi:hypothetical protein
VGPVPQQRAVLDQAGLRKLRNALALANVVLDRAWIRITDCNAFAAQEGGGKVMWQAQADADPDQDKGARLRKIEDWLRARQIVGERGENRLETAVGALSESDRANISNIYTVLTTAKNVMGKMTVVLSEKGPAGYDKNSGQLTIPYSSVGRDAGPLAEDIIAAVSHAGPKLPPGAKGTGTALQNILDNRVSLVLMLCQWDRLDAQPRVDAIRSALTQGGASPVPSPAELAGINTELAFAALDYRADYWRRISFELDKGIRLPRQKSGPAGSLQDGYTATCGALAYLDALPTALTALQQERRQTTVSLIARHLAHVLDMTPPEFLTRRPDDGFPVPWDL